jgi:glutamate 5-kinase
MQPAAKDLALPEPDPARAALKKARRIVVKVGTRLLTGGRLDVDRRYILRLVGAVARLWAQGRQVAIVTSGAIGAGCGRLGFTERPSSLPERQACAAAGQVMLMKLYAQAFRRVRPPRAVGQLLLTRDGLEARQRYLNVRNTLEALFSRGAVPVINENDTVSVDEIRFGDNDMLSALVSTVAEAHLLIILTDVPGLMTAPPRERPDAQLIHTVPEITPEVEALAGPADSLLGMGGMVSKLEAAKVVRASGIPLVLVGGHDPEVLLHVVEGRQAGTYFPPKGDRLAARKQWLAFTAQPRGVLRVDAGAREALVKRHKSLLPSGIVQVEGQFETGDLVALAGPDGRPFARGLSNYSSVELGKIRGKKTSQIAKELGELLFDEVIHRDNLVVL